MTPDIATAERAWLPATSAELVRSVAGVVAADVGTPDGRSRIDGLLDELVVRNDEIHTLDCINLNPAANTMNPQAEAMLARGLGTRPSLGYPAEKYEMGLEAIERIEIVAAELVAQLFGAPFVELRVGSGALANFYAFMACTTPGDAIIAPPASIGGHVTHHRAGAAGLHHLDIHEAPIDAGRYTLDLDALAELAERVQPKVISVGGSLNLEIHDVPGVRAIADAVGAKVLFDAAHLSGPIAGGAWPNPIADGAHLMTMSTYKSFGGPPSGLLLTTEADLAERIDAIAFPGLTANFDVAKTAALAVTALDWLECGKAHGAVQVETAAALGAALIEHGVDVHTLDDGTITRSHAFALRADGRGGDATARHLRQANLLTSAIGLPAGPDAGIRIGTNELVRWGATVDDMPTLAALVAEALTSPEPERIIERVREWRRQFTSVSFTRNPAA